MSLIFWKILSESTVIILSNYVMNVRNDKSDHDMMSLLTK